MATGWDAEMQERFERLEQKVDGLADEVKAIGVKLEANTERLDQKVNSLADEVKAVGVKLDANTERLDHFERTFASKIEIENLRDLVQRSAEGFAASLDRIERGVTETRRDWQLKWEDHDRVLRDQARRITTLESE
jgi:outer membrane murein-binding lipoprotein Lpp